MKNLVRELFWKVAPLVPDALRFKLLFRRIHKFWPDFVNPRTFSEKVQWRKLNDRREILTVFADKYRVRDYIERKIGRKYLSDVYWASDDADSVDFGKLPDKFVLKTNHGTRWNVFVPDKSRTDRHEAVAQLQAWLKDRYPPAQGEWGYLNVKPMAYAEEFLSTRAGEIPRDYKFFVFNGRARMVQVDLDRFISHSRCLYDMDWNLLPAGLGYPQGTGAEKPANFAEMVRCAEAVADGIDFVRADFYNVDGRIVFGEMTNYPGGGLEPFTPPSFDAIVGSWWTLDRV
jgi:hypothetical protein